MKKWVIASVIMMPLFLTGIYLLIPKKIDVTRSVTAKANPVAVYRFLTADSNWSKWWPGSVITDRGTPVFESGGYRIEKSKLLYQGFEILIGKKDHAKKSRLIVFPLGVDSVGIEWTTSIIRRKNPFSRNGNYLKAGEIGRQMENILFAMQNYVSNVEHLYEVNIRKEKVKVEFLVTTEKLFNSYPTTGNIYEMIGEIKNHIAQSQANEEDYPMMHISARDSVQFDVQVAIPVDRNLHGTKVFASKRMLKGGDILVTEITGGQMKADGAMKRMEQYLSDHKYVAIAIPFQSLVTHRLNEPDSNKWVTRIYFPVIL